MSTRDLIYETSRPIGEFRNDFESVTEECCSFLRSVVDDAGTHEVIVPLSGGLDSTTTATLAVEALGCRAVNGLVLPAAASDESNIDDVQRVAFELGIDFRTVNIQPIVDALTESMTQDYWLRAAVGAPGEWADGDDSNDEYRYGDGGADLHPLGDLYKTEVRRLADHLEVPSRIINKQPTAGLWDAQTDTGELGASYETIDTVLRKLLDEEYSIERTADELGVEESLVAQFAEMYRDAAHKRTTPSTPETYVS